jgi:hypothetical protein
MRQRYSSKVGHHGGSVYAKPSSECLDRLAAITSGDELLDFR